MKIPVMGSGAVGGYFGARLALGGADVTFVARCAHAAMRARGLTLETPQGPLHARDIRVVERAAEAPILDLVLLAVKLRDTDSAIDQIKNRVGAKTAVISLQNGVPKEESLAHAFAREQLLGGAAYVATRISRPGVIAQTGTMQRLQFGAYDGSRSVRAAALLQACVAGGINAEIVDDIRRVLWERCVFLSALSGATATIRKPIGPIRSHPRTRAFPLDLMREVVAVGRAHQASSVLRTAEFALGPKGPLRRPWRPCGLLASTCRPTTPNSA